MWNRAANWLMSAAQRPTYLRYGIAIIATLLASLIRHWLDPVLENRTPYTTYFAAVMFTAWYAGPGPTVLAIVGSGMLGSYLFDEPRGSLANSELEHQISLGLFVVVGVFATVLTESLHASRRRLDAARNELAISEQRFRTVADFTYDWEYWMGPDRTPIYSSPSCQRVTGYSVAEFAADPGLWETVTHPADRPAVWEHLRQEDASQAPLGQEFRIVHRQGEVRWIEHFCQAVFGQQGEYLGRRANNRDVTARKAAEAAAQLAQLRLLEQQQRASADKLASVGRLAASVAHEIRNPLTAIKMWLFSLREAVGGQPELQHELAIVSEEIVRLEGIVRGFLELSRPPAVSCRSMVVTEILQRTLEFLGPRLEHAQIRVVQDFVPDLPAVLADAERLKQVLLNLIGNAAEAMRDGGELRLTATCESEADGRRLVVLRVQDTGPGLPQEAQRRLFEPFFTTKEQGTGLGLWLASQIMTQHTGRLVLESSSPRGTVFAVWIPAVKVQSDGQDPGS